MAAPTSQMSCCPLKNLETWYSCVVPESQRAQDYPYLKD